MSGIPVCLTFRKVFIASVFGVGMFLIPNGVQSAVNNSATLQWAANQEPDLGGYTVYHGTTQGIYSDSQDAGNSATFRYADLESNKTHYFSVTAYDKAGNESLPSPEVHKTVIAPDSVLSVSVTGGGTVRSSPAGISCSSGTCSGTFTQGSSVTLTATPGIGMLFDGWNGSCSGTSACVVPVSTSAASVIANFASSPSVSASLTSSPPPSWSLEEAIRLAEAKVNEAKEQKQLARVDEQRARVEKQLAKDKEREAKAERLLAKDEERRAKAERQLAESRIKTAKEQMRVAKTTEQKAKIKEEIAQLQGQRQQARAEERRAKEQEQLAKAKQREAKEEQRLAKAKQRKAQEDKQLAKANERKAKEQKRLVKAKGAINKIQNTLSLIETRLATTNNPGTVARLNRQKDKYSMALAKIQAKYSIN